MKIIPFFTNTDNILINLIHYFNNFKIIFNLFDDYMILVFGIALFISIINFSGKAGKTIIDGVIKAGQLLAGATVVATGYNTGFGTKLIKNSGSSNGSGDNNPNNDSNNNPKDDPKDDPKDNPTSDSNNDNTNSDSNNTSSNNENSNENKNSK
jgi:hypothetical protein